jgi:hypothetical protein
MSYIGNLFITNDEFLFGRMHNRAKGVKDRDLLSGGCIAFSRRQQRPFVRLAVTVPPSALRMDVAIAERRARNLTMPDKTKKQSRQSQHAPDGPEVAMD